MATAENGTKWIGQVSLQTGIKSDPAKVVSAHADYFTELNERNRGVKYFFGTPLFHYRGKCADAYTQVMNNAFPAGLIGVEEAESRSDLLANAGSTRFNQYFTYDVFSKPCHISKYRHVMVGKIPT
jgi:multiple sugar transport system substrate-binding protein